MEQQQSEETKVVYHGYSHVPVAKHKPLRILTILKGTSIAAIQRDQMTRWVGDHPELDAVEQAMGTLLDAITQAEGPTQVTNGNGKKKQ